MEEINFTKEEQQELKEYIKEINKKTYSLDTIRQLIDLKKATIFAKRILQYSKHCIISAVLPVSVRNLTKSVMMFIKSMFLSFREMKFYVLFTLFNYDYSKSHKK